MTWFWPTEEETHTGCSRTGCGGKRELQGEGQTLIPLRPDLHVRVLRPVQVVSEVGVQTLRFMHKVIHLLLFLKNKVTKKR